MSEEFTNTQYESLSYRDHCRLRTGMYVGSKETTDNTLWILNKDKNKLEKQVLKYSIAMYNIIDEIIVNGIDHIHRTANIKGKNKCDTIKLNFNKDTGIISLWNSGEGITVEKYKDQDYYIPEMIFSKEMSGSNFSSNDSKISAGMNGSGAKITNILSSEFIVETTDLKNKLHYYQKFENGNEIKNKPIITKLSKVDKNKKDPFTQITFLIDYKLFDKNGYTSDLANVLEKLLYTRMSYVSVYCGSKIKIYYNDEELQTKCLYDLSKLLLDESDIIKCQLYNKNDKKLNPIDINIGIYDCQDSQESIALLNGLMVNQGTHIRFINKLILENLKSKLEKKLKDKVKITNKLISNYLFIFFSGNLTNPDYKNQSKSELSVSESRFKDYEFDKKVYKQIWDKLETEFDRIYLDKISKENVTKKANKLKGILKYRSADKAGTSDSDKCTLVVPEGDSAESCVRNGLTSNKELGYKYFGIFNIQGVPLNVRKEIDIKEIKKNGHIEYIIDKKKKLLENERINSLIKVMNLNYSYSYDLTPKGDEEYKTLRYGKVLMATDADSVSGDTPLLLKDNNENILIKNIEDLTKEYKSNILTNKEYGSSYYQIWTNNGWTDIKHVMRHKVTKQMYRVITHTGCVDVTEDHSLLNENESEIAPKNCKIGDALLHDFPLFNKIENIPDNLEELDYETINKYAKSINIYKFRTLSKDKKIELLNNYKKKNVIDLNSKTIISEDEAYVMGLFLGDGHCKQSIRIINNKEYTRFTWSISNTNYVLLAKAKLILTKIYGDYFKLREFNKYKNTYSINTKYQLELIGGDETSDIINNYRRLFYYNDSKYIHYELLNSNLKIRKSLFKGYYHADGLHDLSKPKTVNVFTKITTQCIYTLCRSLGYLVSINNVYNSRKQETYILNLSKDKLCRNPNTIKKIYKLENKEMYVYDLETKNHHFQAGIGSMIVHNTDGLGMICSLILNFFNVFFPKLLERRVINIFSTPLIRAYPSKKNKYLEEFYNIEEYNEWLAKVNINDYKINYIKGLAGHSNMEIKYMFKDFHKNIYKFELDQKATDYFEIYFGNDADKRKVILAGQEEYKEDDYKEKYKNKIISCSYQLNTNTKEFQLDNIQRKMPHIIDGLNPARRKVLAGAIKKFKQSNSTIKVFQLGGYIAEHMMYHHGSDSLNKTIINMAQNFAGSRNIPLLLPIGQFGSRYKGGDDAGSARYINTKLNKSVVELLYPTIDNDLLEYNIIDGQYAEPKYFIPILPTVLLEDISLPSTGWKIEVYGRDIDQVINNVKNLIEDNNSKITKMKYFKNKFKGKEVKNKNINMLIGIYNIPKNTKDEVIITELPPKVWNEKYIENLEKKEFIDEILDESTIEDVRIIVNFKKGELNKLISEYQDHKNYSEYLDAIEYNLNLYIKLSHHINFYQINNVVKEYQNYENVIMDWFYIRKDCYIKRINRELILLKYKIIMLENIIRFIENHEQYNISKKSDSIANRILKENSYIELNTTIINNPGLLSNEKLEYHILNINQSYDYLLNLSYRKMNDNSYNNNKNKLKELQDKIKYYQKKDIYKEIWICEIDSLYKELKDKFKNGFYQEDENLFKRQ